VGLIGYGRAAKKASIFVHKAVFWIFLVNCLTKIEISKHHTVGSSAYRFLPVSVAVDDNLPFLLK